MEKNEAQTSQKTEIDPFDDRIFCDECAYFLGKNWNAKCQAGETYLLGIKNRCTLFKIKKPDLDRFWE